MEKLKALYVVAGVAILGGVTFVIRNPLPETVRADVLDAGIASCARRHFLCDVRVTEDGRNILRDAGFQNARRYGTVKVRARVCNEADGGRNVFLPPAPRRLDAINPLEVLDWRECDVVPHDGTDIPGWEPIPAQSRCVRRQPDAGNRCWYVGDDGGLVDPGLWNRIYSIRAIGQDCQPSPCVRDTSEEHPE